MLIKTSLSNMSPSSKCNGKGVSTLKSNPVCADSSLTPRNTSTFPNDLPDLFTVKLTVFVDSLTVVFTLDESIENKPVMESPDILPNSQA